MNRQIKTGADFVAGVQLYLCETFSDINNIPNKNFGDKFLVLNSNNDLGVAMYIVNSEGTICACSDDSGYF